MWINCYDDPGEMTIEEATALLNMHQYHLVMQSAIVKVYQHPFALDRLYFCLSDDDVIELAIGEGLNFIKIEEQKIRKCLADLCLACRYDSCYY